MLITEIIFRFIVYIFNGRTNLKIRPQETLQSINLTVYIISEIVGSVCSVISEIVTTLAKVVIKMSYNNRNQLNPNVWDIRSNNQNYNGQQQQIPSLLNSLFQQQSINNGLMNPSHQFYNNSQNNYQQSQQPMGMMFNNNEQPPFNNRKYNNNNRVNRPGPAFR